MKKKIISILLVFTLLYAMTIPVIASGLNDDLKSAQNKVNSAANQKKEIAAEKNSVLGEISDLEDQIAGFEKELDELNTKIKKLQENIKTKNKEIEELQKEYEKQKKLLEDRLVAIYEEGQITFLDVLLSSENIWDYISMSSRVQELTAANNAQMDELESQRLEVEKAKKELEEQKTQLDTAKKDAESKQQQLKVVKASKETKVANLSAEQKKLQSEIDKYNKEIDRLEEEIRKAAQNTDGKYEGNFNGVLSWPLSSSSRGYNAITSYFGNREQPVAGASTYHRGIDIGVSVGTPVYSAADGVVVTTGSSGVRGVYVMVKHADNLYTFYQHLNSYSVSQGQSVKRGQLIARSGNTGIGSGPHLHFEVRTSAYYGSEVNPLNYTHW